MSAAVLLGFSMSVPPRFADLLSASASADRKVDIRLGGCADGVDSRGVGRAPQHSGCGRIDVDHPVVIAVPAAVVAAV